MGKYSFGSTGPTFEDTKIYPSFTSVTTAATPAAGSCGVQFVFTDINGDALTSPVSGLLYLSESSTGLSHDAADTSLAVLTNGTYTEIIADTGGLFTTTAAGLLGLTITAAADDYYIIFVKPDGSILISDVCTCNSGS